jgi:hypothetical protein
MKVIMNGAREEYADLLNRFISGDLSAPQLQTLFLEKFKREDRRLESEVYELLWSIASVARWATA